MRLTLIRIYGHRATNGYLIANKRVICKTIELPWRQNQQSVSCIPEGEYKVVSRHSPRFGRHLWIQGVRGRRYILFHPANDALRELKGCIAPVMELVGEGFGIRSREAMRKLLDRVLPVLEKGEILTLSIHE